MILLSFSSAEDALTNDVKEYDRFSLQGTAVQVFFFFFFFFWGGTPGIAYMI